MKKKIVAACMVVALASVAVAGGTLAYFTGEDSAINTMAIGDVSIVQNEQQFDANGGLEPFEDGKKFYPMVDNREDGDPVKVDGYFNENMANVIDKIVTVTNTGSEPAYVRTIVAFETVRSYEEGSSTDFVDLHNEYFGVNSDLTYLNEYITLGETTYVLAVKTYDAALPSGETTEPSLRQLFLAPTADNEATEWFGNEYDILVLSQGVQTAGFVDKNDNGTAADEALNAAFGEVNAANAQAWFAAILPQS